MNISNRLNGKAFKSIIPVAFFVLSGIGTLSGQWTRQSPFPTGLEINGVCFVNPSTGWIFGDKGTVLRTNDGGNTWMDQSLPAEEMVSAGFFFDEDHGWLALSGKYLENNGSVYGTNDGGDTWELQFHDDQCTIRDIDFLDPNNGWALAYYSENSPYQLSRNFIMKTVDGGKNWMIMSFLMQSHFRRLDFINDTLGFIAGSGLPNLMKTSDGGANWTVSPHASNGSLTDVQFTDINNGYTCGNNFYFTHNAGASWGLTYCYYTGGVGMYDESGGWTFTIDKLFKVTNGGDILDYQFSVDKSMLTAISVVDSANAYLVGKNVTILATHDAGGSWQEISNGTHESLFSVFFTDENNGWAGGDGRTLLHTRDGGRHWIFENVDAGPGAIYDIQFLDIETGWFVNGDIYSTTNGGNEWKLASGLDFQVNDVYFTDYLAGWCVGPGGRLYKSGNGGLDWEEKSSATGKDLNAVYFLDENYGWIAGEGIILKTGDGGESWENSYTGLSYFQKIQFLNQNTGYVLADDVCLKTIDGGGNWAEIQEELSPGDIFNDFYFINEDEGYLSGSDFILKTEDGGLTWEADPGFQGIKPNAVFFVNESVGWVVGDEGAIFQTGSGGSFSIDDPHEAIGMPSCFIFPNPSGDNISVKCSLEISETVEIEIYTIQGGRILYHKENPGNSGEYIFNWEPEALPLGIYLCRIRIGEFCATEKIVYIK